MVWLINSYFFHTTSNVEAREMSDTVCSPFDAAGMLTGGGGQPGRGGRGGRWSEKGE